MFYLFLFFYEGKFIVSTLYTTDEDIAYLPDRLYISDKLHKNLSS